MSNFSFQAKSSFGLNKNVLGKTSFVFKKKKEKNRKKKLNEYLNK